MSVLHGDGTLGWAEHAPYDAIIVAAGGPKVPEALLEQLATGGRLVIPVGEGRNVQRLLRVTRGADGRFHEEELGDVRFVPLIGAQGWMAEASEWNGRPAQPLSRPGTLARLVREVAEPLESIDGQDLGALLERLARSRLVLIGEATHGTSEFYRMRARITQELDPHARVQDRRGRSRLARRAPRQSLRPDSSGRPSARGGGLHTLPDVDVAQSTLVHLVREAAEPIESIEGQDLGALLERLGRARLVLIGEASHGTSEFYRMRARITQELIRTRGFGIVAVEADWPDARRVGRYVQTLPDGHRPEEAAFTRFPTWMWRNHETWGFIEWLRVFNAETPDPARHAAGARRQAARGAEPHSSRGSPSGREAVS